MKKVGGSVTPWNITRFVFTAKMPSKERGIQTNIFQRMQARISSFHFEIDLHQNQQALKEVQEEAEFLNETVHVLAKRTRQSKVLSDIPARKCLFCCNFSNSDPFEYLWKFDTRLMEKLRMK